MSAPLRFIRKNGRVIPIGAAVAGAGRVAQVAGAALKTRKGIKASRSNGPAKVHGVAVKKGFDLAGLGLSVASGAIAAATFGHGIKGLAAGAVASHGLDAAGIGFNIASVAGKGHAKDRAKQGARQEARNLIVGNAVYAAGILASSRNRAAAATYTKKVLEFGRKALRIASAAE